MKPVLKCSLSINHPFVAQIIKRFFGGEFWAKDTPMCLKETQHCSARSSLLLQCVRACRHSVFLPKVWVLLWSLAVVMHYCATKETWQTVGHVPTYSCIYHQSALRLTVNEVSFLFLNSLFSKGTLACSVPLLGILYTSIQLTKPTVLDQCRSKSICCVNFNLQVECDTVLYSPESFPVTKKCISLQSSLLLPFNLGRWGRGKSCEAQKIWKNI